MPKVILNEDRVYRGQRFIKGEPVEVDGETLATFQKRGYVDSASETTSGQKPEQPQSFDELLASISPAVVAAWKEKGIDSAEKLSAASDDDLKVTGAGEATIAKARELAKG